jgi:hypothetical protein
MKPKRASGRTAGAVHGCAQQAADRLNLPLVKAVPAVHQIANHAALLVRCGMKFMC